MSGLITLFFYTLMLCSFSVCLWLWKEKQYLTLSLVASFFLKLALVQVMDTGLKYMFVQDSLKYELDAWNLIKSNITHTNYVIEAFERYEYLNPFTQIGMVVFYVFGKSPAMITLINVFAHTAMAIFCLLSLKSLLNLKQMAQNQKNLTALSVMILFYPSLNIWAATNTKDPLSLLCIWIGIWSLLQVRHFRYSALAWLALSALTIYLSGLFRPYMPQLLMGSLGLGLVLYIFSRFVSLRQITIGGLILAVVCGFAWEYFTPDSFSTFSKTVFATRKGFLNEEWVDDYSRSAFLVNFQFNSFLDYLRFIPMALSYYFVSPFPWEIQSTPEALGLIEVGLIVGLAPSALRGLKGLTRKNPFGSYMLLGSMIVFSISQSLMIGNIGTLFRHRSFVILIYFLFAAAGMFAPKASAEFDSFTEKDPSR